MPRYDTPPHPTPPSRAPAASHSAAIAVLTWRPWPGLQDEVDEVHEQMMMWSSFAQAWDELVNDLRENDMLSDAESHLIKFCRLDVGGKLYGLRPILLPTFFYAGQIRKVVDTGRVSTAQVRACMHASIRAGRASLGLRLRPAMVGLWPLWQAGACCLKLGALARTSINLLVACTYACT